MTCRCIEVMDAKLADYNGRLSATICFPRTDAVNLGQPYDTVTIEVKKIAPRGKRPPLAAPTFCPFCGERYVPKVETPSPRLPEAPTQGALGDALQPLKAEDSRP